MRPQGVTNTHSCSILMVFVLECKVIEEKLEACRVARSPRQAGRNRTLFPRSYWSSYMNFYNMELHELCQYLKKYVNPS